MPTPAVPSWRTNHGQLLAQVRELCLHVLLGLLPQLGRLHGRLRHCVSGVLQDGVRLEATEGVGERTACSLQKTEQVQLIATGAAFKQNAGARAQANLFLLEGGIVISISRCKIFFNHVWVRALLLERASLRRRGIAWRFLRLSILSAFFLTASHRTQPRGGERELPEAARRVRHQQLQARREVRQAQHRRFVPCSLPLSLPHLLLPPTHV